MGEPKPEDFELAEVELASRRTGRLLVRNVFMSVDPYMRGRMNDAKSYVPPYELGKVMYGGAVGEVVAGGEPGRSWCTSSAGARRRWSTRTACSRARCRTACRPARCSARSGCRG